MKKARVLYVSQEIYPYMAENTMSNVARFLPQGIQERGKEILVTLLRRIKEVIPQIADTDILVFNSHGETKLSYHIIIDNWCFFSKEENRGFFDENVALIFVHCVQIFYLIRKSLFLTQKNPLIVLSHFFFYVAVLEVVG